MHPKVDSLSLIAIWALFGQLLHVYRVLTHLGEDPQEYKYGPPQPKTSSYAPG